MNYLKKTKFLIQMTDGSTLFFFFISNKKYSFIDSDSRSNYLRIKSSSNTKESINVKYKTLFVCNKK